MSYQTDDGEHEGWEAAEFRGGWFSVGSNGAGAMVRRFGPGPLRGQHRGARETIDGREALGWRGLCECGWRGPLWERVQVPAEHDPASHKVYDPDPSPYGDAPAEVEDAIHREWTAHLEPETLISVRSMAQAVNDAQAQLTEAVREARRDGRSWADIGGAVGISRQSAHERWGQIRA